MNGFKEKCTELRKADYTLPEICKVTGRSKTSVYFHIRNIPLSFRKQQLIKSNSGLRFAALATARKGKSERSFKKFKWDRDMVNMVAHFIFDGSITSTSCEYNNRSKTLIEKVSVHMDKIYEFKPRVYLNKNTGVIKIAYFNVALSIYIKSKSEELLGLIQTLPKSLKKEFLVAFFDDEGCMDYREKVNMRRIRGYQKNTDILLIVKKLLHDIGIGSHIVEPNEVVISGKENLKKFQKGINFSEGVCINGNRSNSIWKKPLEKRFILDQAIKSFQK